MAFTAGGQTYQGGPLLAQGIGGFGQGIAAGILGQVEEQRKKQALTDNIMLQALEQGYATPEDWLKYSQSNHKGKQDFAMRIASNFHDDAQKRRQQEQELKQLQIDAAKQALGPPQILNLPTGETTVSPTPVPRQMMPGPLAPNPFEGLPDISTLPQMPPSAPSILPELPPPAQFTAPVTGATREPRTVQVLRHGGNYTLIPGQAKAVSGRAGQIEYHPVTGQPLGVWDEQGNLTQFKEDAKVVSTTPPTVQQQQEAAKAGYAYLFDPRYGNIPTKIEGAGDDTIKFLPVQDPENPGQHLPGKVMIVGPGKTSKVENFRVGGDSPFHEDPKTGIMMFTDEDNHQHLVPGDVMLNAQIGKQIGKQGGEGGDGGVASPMGNLYRFLFGPESSATPSPGPPTVTPSPMPSPSPTPTATAAGLVGGAGVMPSMDEILAQMGGQVGAGVGPVQGGLDQIIKQIASAARAGAATSSGIKRMSPKDRQALEWARANPGDPRAAAILNKLGYFE